MSITTVNPTDLYDPVPFGYSHTATVPAGAGLVFVSGQYASDPRGQVVSTDFAAQVEQAFANLGRALTAHDLELSHVVQLRTYVVGIDFDRLGVIGQAVGTRWGQTPPAQTLVGVAGLAMPDMFVEIEAIAARL